MQPNFWRGPTDNDYGNGAPLREDVWKRASKDFSVKDASISVDADTAKIDIDYLLPSGNIYNICYRIYPSGVVKADVHFAAAKDAPELPRLGMRFRMPQAMECVEYYGRGPCENYIDRKASSKVGVYVTTASNMYFPYVRPQENGHHTDTRWLSLTDNSGHGLKILADSLIEFNALRNTVEDFDSEEAVQHPYNWPNRSAEEIASRDEKAVKVYCGACITSMISFRVILLRYVLILFIKELVDMTAGALGQRRGIWCALIGTIGQDLL